MPKKKKSRTKKAKRARRRGIFIKLVLGLFIVTAVGLVVLDSIVQKKFSGRKWTVPASVYARPLELYSGQPITTTQLEYELKLLGYQSATTIKAGKYNKQQSSLRLHTRGFRFGDGLEPAIDARIVWVKNSINQILNAEGKELELLRLEPVKIGGIYPSHNEDRLLIELEQTPKGMLECLLAVEDRSFYSHFGISPKGIARAMWVNLQAGSWRQGGSTITQQLMKNLYLTTDKSLLRKLIEMPMAIMVDLHFSKHDILQAFVNEVFLAQDGGRAIHGFGLASQYFFNQPLQELKPHQYALLVGMIKGPSYYNPLTRPQRAIARRNVVLGVMAKAGIMSEEETEYARSLPLDVSKKPARTNRHPAYLDLVRRQLKRDYQMEDLQNEGLRIFTNFDPILQYETEQSMQRSLDAIGKRYAGEPEWFTKLEAAVVLTNASNGEVLAIVGGRNPRFAGFNRALDARRPIGSLVKPAVYLSALEEPDNYTLATYIEDTEFELPQPDGSVWAPDNFDHESHGSVTLLEAISQSYNRATARLGLAIGVEKVSQTMRNLGVQSVIPHNPSLLLGAIDLSALDIAEMYQTIALAGFQAPLRAIREVLDAQGEPLTQYSLKIQQRFAPDSMHILQYAMQATMREGTGRRAYWHLPRTFAVAGKTGTSSDQRDSWFAGFAGDYLAVTWLGTDDNADTPLTGSSGALSVWSDLFAHISRQPLNFVRPEGIVYAWTDADSGELSAARCEGARYMPYIAGTEPLDAAPCVRKKRTLRSWFQELFD
ncbi:MAG: penicillin-binding protein 1B [Pseudomonadales bacterium]